MARGPCTFRQTDLKSAIKGARAAGMEIDRVEIRDGVIVMVASKPGEPVPRGDSQTQRQFNVGWQPADIPAWPPGPFPACVRTDEPRALMPAVRMTLPHFSVSAAMNLANSVGVLAKGPKPNLASWALNAASARAALTC